MKATKGSGSKRPRSTSSILERILMKVEVKIDGSEIPLSGFPQEMLGNVVASMTECLHGVDPNWREITIRVDK